VRGGVDQGKVVVIGESVGIPSCICCGFFLFNDENRYKRV
jgi:hypothetical protein